MTNKNDHRRIGFDDIDGDLATAKQFAMLTGMHENSIRKMCQEGRIECKKIGVEWRIPFRKICGVEKEAEVV
ncbi:MAG: helix-turn-helix domain-containing protein [Raoultibacter sp.]